MRTWIIDTSTERGFIASVENGKVLIAHFLPLGDRQSTHLFPLIQNAFPNLKSDHFDCIGVGIGPGSYTGIRIGVAVAKALAYAWNIPLVSFSSLEAFIPQKEGPFTVLLDAKIAGVYVLQGERDGPSIRYLDPPRTYPLDQLGSLLTEGIIITPYQAQLKAKLDLLYPYLIWSEVDPDPAHVACLVAQRYQEKSIDSLEHLELLYLR